MTSDLVVVGFTPTATSPPSPGTGPPPRFVTLGDAADPDRIVFDGNPDAFGVRWCAEGISGWDSPEQQLLLADRPVQDGQIHLLGRYSGKPLDLINPVLLAPSDAARAAAMDRLARTTQLVRSTRRLILTEANTTRFADVYRREPVRMRVRPPVMDNRRGMLWPAVLEVPFVALDPRKYDTAEQSNAVTLAAGAASGSVTTNNAGTYETPWVATISASGWGGGILTLSGPGDKPKVAMSGVPAMSTGDSLVVDSAKRTIKLNGTNRRDLAASLPDWSRLAAPSMSFAATRGTTTGSLTLTVVYRSAWI